MLHAVTWWLVPVYLHLHLLVPTPLLARYRRYLLPPLYALAAILAGLELFQALPPEAFYLGLFLAGVGSLALLFTRLFIGISSLARLATGQILAGIALAFGPGFALWVVPGLLHAPQSGMLNIYLMTFAASLLPFFYIYAVYKRLLGGLEFRANRALSLFSFLVVYLTTFVVVFVLSSQWVSFTPASLGFALTVSMLFVIGGLFLHAPFQRLINRLAYGTEHNPNDIIRAFANEIPRALNRDALVSLLTGEVNPSLLIRQSALYLWKDGQASLFYADGVALDPEMDASEQVRQWLADAKRYRPPKSELGEVSPEEQEADWVRLVIPIEVGDTVLGVWLFGQRDPDDYYPKPDIELLATLANQVGVALETMRLIEDLRHQASELEKAYEGLKELDRLKDEFIQNVSHELRTPLAVIRGYTDLLLEGLLGEISAEQRQAFQIVSDRVDAVIRLVNDILSFQQGPTLPLVREPIYLAELAQFSIRNAEILVQKMGRKDQFRFVLEASEDLPVIWGDYNRLSQVFDNLLGNAIKFSPEGGTITVRIRPCEYQFISRPEGGSRQSAIEVTVSDQGIGIPPEQIHRIWERFYQVDGSSTRRFGGAGIGLTIARNIIQAHGGVIWAESQVGVGSTFHFVLPVHESPLPSEGTGTYQNASVSS
jgi:signal transduction histidine kinase